MPSLSRRPSNLAAPMAEAVLKNAEIAYGSDSSGLICGYVFTPGQSAQAIDSAAASDWLQARPNADSAEFVWLHLSLANVNSEKWLIEHLPLPEQYYETLREGPGSTRIEQADDCLIAVINDVIYDFS